MLVQDDAPSRTFNGDQRDKHACRQAQKLLGTAKRKSHRRPRLLSALGEIEHGLTRNLDQLTEAPGRHPHQRQFEAKAAVKRIGGADTLFGVDQISLRDCQVANDMRPAQASQLFAHGLVRPSKGGARRYADLAPEQAGHELEGLFEGGTFLFVLATILLAGVSGPDDHDVLPVFESVRLVFARRQPHLEAELRQPFLDQPAALLALAVEIVVRHLRLRGH
jgi:hypothetical protein